MLRDEISDRDSYAWFTRDGLFYTLDLPTNQLLLTHVIAVDEVAEKPLQKIPPLRALFPTASSTGTHSSLEASAEGVKGKPRLKTSEESDLVNEEEQRREANASLVASVLAQAQHAAAMAVRTKPVESGAEKTASIPKVLEPGIFSADSATDGNGGSPSGTANSGTTVKLSLSRSNVFVPNPIGGGLSDVNANAGQIAIAQKSRMKWNSVEQSNEPEDDSVMRQKPRPLLKGAPPPIKAVAEIRNLAETKKISSPEGSGASVSRMRPGLIGSINIGGSSLQNSIEEEEGHDAEVHDLICFICIRQFPSKDDLYIHEEKSKLHQVSYIILNTNTHHSCIYTHGTFLINMCLCIQQTFIV